MNRKISVVIPVYKCEETLGSCIESVLNQSYKNLEVILIDDGSPDNSGKMCEEYSKSDNRVRAIHKENGGVSSARNLGIDEAIGDYIIFIDSDDTLELETFEVLINKVNNNNLDLIMFGMKFDYYVKENLVKSHMKVIKENLIFEDGNIRSEFFYLYNCNYLSSVCNKLIKLNLIKKNNIKFNEELTIYEDLEFVIRTLFYTKRIMAIKDCFYNYRNDLLNVGFSKRVENDYMKNFKILNNTLWRYADYSGMKSENERKILRGLSFRYYLIYLEKKLIEKDNENLYEKILLAKEFVNDKDMRKYLDKSYYDSIGIRMAIKLTKMKNSLLLIFLVKGKFLINKFKSNIKVLKLKSLNG